MTAERPGPLALLGSGEFLPVMREIDRGLIDQVGGPPACRVAVIPTASGLEPGMPDKWAQLGLDHFAALGVPAEAVMITERADAAVPEWLTALRRCNVFYFSGGNPLYVVETFRETPAWEIIRTAHQAGAVLAGCSAGAMMLGGVTIRVRDVAAGRPPIWEPALGLLPEVAIIPHFDRITKYVNAAVMESVLATCPPEILLLGIDEDTALVQGAGPAGAAASGVVTWRVLGRGAVCVLQQNGVRDEVVYQVGETVPLSALAVTGEREEAT